MSTSSGKIAVLEDGSICVVFDLQLYSLSAIKTAAYKFARDCSAFLSQPNTDVVEVRLSFDKAVEQDKRDAIVRAFCSEVLDQDLREQIARETEGTRNLILAEAFSKTSLLKED